jgi:tetratricopeptide (TPR) repeat protein
MLGLTGCGPINGIFARRDLIEGAKAYKERNYVEAEKRFRSAMSLDPSQKTAQLFLARTLHSVYASNRSQTAKAEEAITVYKQVLAGDPGDNASFKAVANLFETMGRKDDLQKWLLDRTADTKVPSDQRAEAFTSLAAKDNTCANEITDIEPVKKTVEKDGKATFVFTKPANAADYEKLIGCVKEGTGYIDNALKLDDGDVTNKAKSIDIKSLSDADLSTKNEVIKKFESAWSYKTSLLIQNSRISEMDGKTPEKDAFKKEAEEARQHFLDLAGVRKAMEDEKEARRKKAEEEKAPGGAKSAASDDSNTNSAK